MLFHLASLFGRHQMLTVESA